jgi:predicted phage terminase large subunit-like protein
VNTPALVDVERELLGRSFPDFMRDAWRIIEPGVDLQWGFHLDAICEFLAAISAGSIRRGVLEMPPRLGKSISTSVIWPAWVWATQPSTKWIFGSYAQHLALRDAVKHREIIRSRWYQERWPLELVDAGDTKGYFRNEQGGHRFAASVGGVATGEGADILVVDDPLKVQDAHSELARAEALRWWREVMPSRLNDQRTGRKLVVMQRLHEADLAGWCRENDYEALSLPLEYDPATRCVVPTLGWQDPRTEPGELLAPERIGPDEVVELRRELGSYAFAGQFNQLPAPDDGTAWFPTDQWQLWDSLPKNPDGTLRRPDDAVVSWDMTFTGKRMKKSGKGMTNPDYVVGQLWYRYGAMTYLIDEVRGQWSFTKACSHLEAFDERCRTVHPFPPRRHVVETKANGEAILDQLRPIVPGVVGFDPDPYGDKVSRALAVQPRVEAGQVFLPRGAPWLDDWRHELRVFPNGRWDDRVDGFAQAHLVMQGSKWGAV